MQINRARVRQDNNESKTGRELPSLSSNGNLFTHRLIRVKQSKINSEKICNPLSVTGEGRDPYQSETQKKTGD